MTPLHLQSQPWLVFLIYHSGTLFCLLLSFVRTFVILLGLHEYSGIISPLEGQMISKLNSTHNLNSPLLCNTTYSQIPGTRMWISLLETGEGVTSFWLLQLFITHWVPLSLRAVSSLHWFPLYSPPKYLTTYSKYQMLNGIENSDILRIRNLSNLSQMTQNFSGVVLT